ncbi:hypothetical protein ACS0TY_024134 [Phlomoides rotata]
MYVKLLQSSLPNEDVDVKTLEQIWKSHATGKSIILAWKVLQDRLATKVNLARRNVDLRNDRCVRCDECREDSEHMFLVWPFATETWTKIYAWFGITSVLHSLIAAHFDHQHGIKPRFVKKSLWITI